MRRRKLRWLIGPIALLLLFGSGLRERLADVVVRLLAAPALFVGATSPPR